MNLMKKITARPTAWIAGGVVLGAIGTGAVISATNGHAAYASPKISVSPVASISKDSMRNLEALDESFVALSDYVSPTVVHIKVTDKPSNNGAISMGGEQGSGVIYRSDGYIITNDHVVRSNDSVTVVLNDGREIPGKVIRGNDPQYDVAVVKVNQKDLPAAQFGDSDQVKSGQFALAFGAPYGIENTVTVGHISGIGRTNQIADPNLSAVRGYSNMIQTDAPINPGNSGGPLVNISGQVIGINSSIYGGSQGLMGGQAGNVGIGFAIPSNQVRTIADILIEKGKLVRAYMGVAPRDLKPFEKKDLGITTGAYIDMIPNDSPAALAGLHAKDVVTKIGGTPVRSEQDLRLAMFRYSAGTKVNVEFLRDGKPQTVAVNLTAIPAAPKAQSQLTPQQPDTTPNLRKRMRDFFGDPFQQDQPQTPKQQPNETPARPSDGKPHLGVGVAELTPQTRNVNHIPDDVQGALVTSVETGSIAEELDMKEGVVVTRFDGKVIRNAKDLADAVRATKSGQSLSISFTEYTENGQMQRSMTFKMR